MYDILGCSLLALVLYYNTLSAGFAYDDSRAILKNQDLLPETPLSQIFLDDFWGTQLTHSGSHKSYRPLCVLTFRLNYALGELDPFGYHLLNVLLHAVATGLVTYSAKLLFNQSFPAVLTGLLFASHPIHTEAVAGVVGRADVGACVFFLCSFLCYINYCKYRDDIPAPTDSSKSNASSSVCLTKWLFLLSSCALTTLSMLTKEQGITVLAVNVTFDIFVQHHLRLCDVFHMYKKHYQHLQEGVISQLLCGGALLSFRIFSMGSRPPDFAPADNPAADADDPLTRILTFSYLPAVNLWLLLWPHILSFDWSMEAIPLVTSFADRRNLVTIAFYAGLSAIVYYCVTELDALYEMTNSSDRTTKNNANYVNSISTPKYGNGRVNGHCSSSHGNGKVNGNLSTSHKFGNGNGHINGGVRHSNGKMNGNGHSIGVKHSNGKVNGNGHINGVRHSNGKMNVNGHINGLSRHTNGNGYHPQHTLSNGTGTSNGNGHIRHEGLRKRLTFQNGHQNGHNSTISSSSQHYKANHRTTLLNVVLISLAFLIFPFIPATNVFFYVGFVVAERILYIPSIGFCLLMATTIDQIYRKLSSKSGKYIVVAMVIVQLLMYSSRTVLRNWDWHSEETLYRSGISVNPAKAWGNLANILKSQGKEVEAEEAYRNALGYRGNMADVHYNLGILLQESKRYDEAIESYEMAIKCRPRMSMAHLNLGIVLSAVGRNTEAEAVYHHASTLDDSGLKDPKNQMHGIISSLFNLGRLLHDQSRYEEALQVFLEAIEKRPDHYSPQSLYNMLGETYYKLGKLRDAEKWYKDSLKAKPDHVPVHLTYANMLSKTNRLFDAEHFLKRAMDLEPTNIAVYQHYAQFFTNQGKHTDAATMFESAFMHYPDDYDLTFNLANALRQAKDGERAETFYRKAVQIQPDNASGHMNLGAMLHINNKLAEAEASYLEALRLKPEDPTTTQNLKKLRNLVAKEAQRRR